MLNLRREERIQSCEISQRELPLRALSLSCTTSFIRTSAIAGMNFATGITEDVDLDNVLDNYLTQLHGDVPASGGVQGQAPGMMMPDGLAGLGGQMGGMGGLLGMQGGMGQAGMFAGMQGMQGMGGLAGLQGMGGMPGMQMAAAGMDGSGGGRTSGDKGKAGGPRGRRASEKVASKAAADDSDAQSSDGSASSGEQKSRKKRELGNDDDMTAAEKRHLALQEKNRRAQRRFRERQKVRMDDLSSSTHVWLFVVVRLSGVQA
uniref:BZIP domain-containing protein n=1 Tax=Tetradesmus obliquus TaxID=3088 RepID=A0A383VF89_TETOB|eukprot:jgi/Sobl393_1/18448/SZX64225.1